MSKIEQKLFVIQDQAMTNLIKKHSVYSLTKRLFDITVSAGLLVLLFPFMLLLAFIIKRDSNGPIIFKQKRYGKNKQTFTIYKFRTMKNGAHKVQHKLSSLNEAPFPMFKIKNDPRFTHIGKFLSRYGLDELPQLFNILKGEMSFVGPRPLPISESKKLDNSWNFRYGVKPGIISFWAIHQDRHKSLKTWKQLEFLTVKNTSLLTEFQLLILAFWKIFLKNN